MKRLENVKLFNIAKEQKMVQEKKNKQNIKWKRVKKKKSFRASKILYAEILTSFLPSFFIKLFYFPVLSAWENKFFDGKSYMLLVSSTCTNRTYTKLKKSHVFSWFLFLVDFPPSMLSAPCRLLYF